jgi:hypothetical protein
LECWQQTGISAGSVRTLGGLAVALATHGMLKRVTWLFGVVSATASSAAVVPSPRDLAERERWINEARTQLGEAAFEATWQAGFRLSLDHAVAEALALWGLPSQVAVAYASGAAAAGRQR